MGRQHRIIVLSIPIHPIPPLLSLVGLLPRADIPRPPGRFRAFCPKTPTPPLIMVMAYKIKLKMREVIPAVVHQDGTGRLQTVEKEVNLLYWKLIRSFGDATGVPVLLNTSSMKTSR